MKTYIRSFCLTFLLLAVAATQTVFGQVPDPGASGSLAVTREEYDFGDTAFQPSDFPGPVELRASIHSPTNLSGGPFPVIVFLHGRHATCFKGGTQLLEWPCTTNNSQPIPSYKGYDTFQKCSPVTATLSSRSVQTESTLSTTACSISAHARAQS